MHYELRRRVRNSESRVFEGFSYLNVEVTQVKTKKGCERGEPAAVGERNGGNGAQSLMIENGNPRSTVWNWLEDGVCFQEQVKAKARRLGRWGRWQYLPQGCVERESPTGEHSRGQHPVGSRLQLEQENEEIRIWTCTILRKTNSTREGFEGIEKGKKRDVC